ncbi:NAD(P)/FAD-dependent oxidoreductase [Leptolyngbya sp. AN02str]|uniref:NAD(P)/FAD-dependent oxidoreductase n=1 Tax=Leptolyngbya sp. AN02str TaxID=3423363 RepID=UPI003D31A1BE
MTAYDWILVGAGLAGSALGYELAKAGYSVLLLDQDAALQNATRYSYGGIAYWSGTTELTQTLCREARALYPTLAEELGHNVEYRELDLLLTIAPDRDQHAIAANYSTCSEPPKLISTSDALELEPLLNADAIASALHAKHGHVNPELTALAYRHAMQRHGGQYQTGTMEALVRSGNTIQGVIASGHTYNAANVVICAGGLSRTLLKTFGFTVPVYYTQAELIETPPLDFTLSALIMPAELKRFAMEDKAGQPSVDALWDEPGNEVFPPILDEGAIQFCNGQIRIGQISRTLTNPYAMVDASASEAAMRSAVGTLLPQLTHVPGQWFSCLVAFSGDRLPLVGAIPFTSGLHVFSGFSNPFALLPPAARRFAHQLTGQPDGLLAQLSPARFATSFV